MADKAKKPVQQIATPGGRARPMRQTIANMPSQVNAKVSGLLPGNSGGRATVTGKKADHQMEKPALR